MNPDQNTKAINLTGGLGDLIIMYHRNPLLLKLATIKARNQWKIRLVIVSHNPGSRDLFKHHPCMDEIVWSPWDDTTSARNGLSRFFSKPCEILNDNYNIFNTDCIQDDDPEESRLYLSKKEEAEVDEITSRGKYVCCHLYAGKSHQNLDHAVDLNKLMEIIIDHDYNAVIVGGTNPVFKGQIYRVTEQFRPNHPRIFHVSNKIRTCFQLVKNAEKFIGTDSCYACAAAVSGIPFMVMAPDRENWDESPNGARTIMKKSGAVIKNFTSVNNCDKLTTVVGNFLKDSSV